MRYNTLMFLDDILVAKKKEAAVLPLSFLKNAVKNVLPPIAFPSSKDKFFTIAEIKKASPSKGILRADLDPASFAKLYEAGGADAISVVTEREFFKGNLEYIRRVKSASKLPVLRKDFIISEAQIYESRIAGADALLLIARIVDEPTLVQFVAICKSLGMKSIVEIHSEAEAATALKTEADIIGINNRDLQTFSADVRHTLLLLKKIPALKERVVLSESGIRSKNEIEALKANGVSGVLLGEVLVKAADPAAKLRELLV
ncbi:MAG: indole-3-glycerol phosphate synthase TrpC [Candidatus Margulisiibacteriota bacterium]